MNKADNIFSNISYAEWLEDALKDLITFPVKGICINAVGKTGEVYTNYHEITMLDKIKIAGIIQQDAMLETMAMQGLINYSNDDANDDEA